jgi:hypothetical protein
MPFIRIYTSGVTDINYNVPLIGFMFVLNGLLYNLKTPQGMLVISAGMFRETRVQTTVQGLIAVVLGLALAPFIGIYGVLLASILSNIYRDIDLLFFIPKNITKLPVIQTAKRMLLVGISVVVICTPFIYIEINANGYFEWIFNAILVGIYACVVIVIMSLLFDRVAFKASFNRVVRMVKR